MELLNDYDLREMCKLKKIPMHYIGYKNTFTKITPKPGAYIINLDNSSSRRGGTHWTALILHSKKKAIYFDPFGLPIPIPIRKFIMQYKPSRIFYSTRQIQDITSVLCGYFCIYFLHYFNTHKHPADIGFLINNHDGIYDQVDRKHNDVIIQNLIKSMFFKKT